MLTNGRTWKIDSTRPCVLTAIEILGVGRCMFASNFPADKLFSNYDRIFNAFRAITINFPEPEGPSCCLYDV